MEILPSCAFVLRVISHFCDSLLKQTSQLARVFQNLFLHDVSRSWFLGVAATLDNA